jgi:pyruvate dehydrogenase E2 component (dihydrolipoamide acetyltransferase)
MATITLVAVPDIGDFADVPVIEILVNVGDSVAAEDPLLTLESDKATMDVPSPMAGVVAKLLVSIGSRVSEGTPILELAPHRDAGAPAEAAAPGSVDGAAFAEADARPESTPSPAPSPTPVPVSVSDPDGFVYASPSVRRLARELGIDLSSIDGSGRKGRILPEDIRGARDRPAAPGVAVPAGAGLGLAPWPKVDFAKYGEVEVQPLSRIKRISGPNLHRNWVMIPHVTHNDEADITDLEAFRVRTNKERERQGVKLTMVALLLKASVAALKEYPELNASLDGDNLVLKRYYHLGFAADTPQGLVVPVIHDVDKKGLVQLADELRELSAKARDGKLGPADMAGGTFTISSLGGIGGTGFTPIVNAPEVAILGATRSAQRPVWNGKEFVPRLMLPLSLSYDHRVIDGALAARFTAYLANALADLRRVLL